jgi:hypothetical protein
MAQLAFYGDSMVFRDPRMSSGIRPSRTCQNLSSVVSAPPVAEMTGQIYQRSVQSESLFWSSRDSGGLLDAVRAPLANAVSSPPAAEVTGQVSEPLIAHKADENSWFDAFLVFQKRLQAKTTSQILAAAAIAGLTVASVKILVNLLNDPKVEELCCKLARLSLEHPDPKVMEYAYKVHAELKKTLVNCPDEVLEFLIGGSVLHARGGFYNAAHLRQFLNAAPRTMSSERLICGFETLGTAIGYRLISATWTRKPYAPETENQKEIVKFLKSRTSLLPPIGARYPDRGNNVLLESKDPLEEPEVIPSDGCCAGVQRKKNQMTRKWMPKYRKN